MELITTSMARSKALARFLYANLPGIAAARFTIKDQLAFYFPKPEYRGIRLLSIESGLIVDIGANRGQSIAAFKRYARHVDIIAFEPETISASRLIARYRSDESVSIHARALGEETGFVKFYSPTYGRWNCDGMAATSRKEATEWLGDAGRMYRFDERKLSITEYSVPCGTLDSYRLAPTLIKLHAQGAEYNILRGSFETLRQHSPALMCAFPTPKVADFLAELGYRPHNYCQGKFDPGLAVRPMTFTWYLTDRHLHHLIAEIT